MLTAVVFLPAAAALLIAFAGRNPRAVRLMAVAAFLADFALALAVFVRYDADAGGFQMVERYPWLPDSPVAVQYLLGVDGLSATMVLMTGVVGLSAALSSMSVQRRTREYFICLLLIQTAAMGVFVSLDFVLFFVMWELELVPVYVLIALWGTGRKEYSAMKFFAFTFAGSALMLVAILVVFFSLDTFDMRALLQSDLTKLVAPVPLVFGLFFAAFAVKLPIWPVHTWQPDAYADAPIGASVMLAGVLSKLGGYGLIRVNVAMFPEQADRAAFTFAVLAVITVLYAGFLAFRQTDLKRLIAYSSLSHMGLVLLGVASVGAAGAALSEVGLTGAALLMFTHGTIVALLFVVVGLLDDRVRTRHLPDLGGLAGRMPFIGVALMVGGLAALGLPGLSGFAAELTVFLGTYPAWAALTGLAAVGVVLAAGYVVWMLRGVLFGPPRPRWATVADANLLEKVGPGLLIVAVVAVGVYPALLTDTLRVGALEALAGRLTMLVP
ncbi:MAG: NADH-quinone oxidoreductase subunit M [Dehalococcoidia bacterium]|nr:NADH-quinone oxidoreductase subunit M [Dehalococcoidia bacterium]